MITITKTKIEFATPVDRDGRWRLPSEFTPYTRPFAIFSRGIKLSDIYIYVYKKTICICDIFTLLYNTTNIIIGVVRTHNLVLCIVFSTHHFHRVYKVVHYNVYEERLSWECRGHTTLYTYVPVTEVIRRNDGKTSRRKSMVFTRRFIKIWISFFSSLSNG